MSTNIHQPPSSDLYIHPLVSISFQDPFFFDYTDPLFSQLPVRDTLFMQKWTEDTLKKNGKKWWIAWYLEDRSRRLQGTHLIDQWRIYHLGVDIIAPADTPILSPLDGEVIESSVEIGKASYGGYVVIRYPILWENFCVLYGHLDPNALHSVWPISIGSELGKIGSSNVNGDWTTHLHMQAFTGKDIDIWKSKGYCTLSDIPTIQEYCPDPSFLIRY
jgi:murein DD-endopeptidase MepM/ murein hydrolase activator NlpD